MYQKFFAMSFKTIVFGLAISTLCAYHALAQRMEEMWDGGGGKSAVSQNRGKLFREGKYALFIHWGIYSQLANKWQGKTYYGIGEWLMNKSMANIPPAEYKLAASSFHPDHFDAKAIVQLAKDAGMRYIVITSKHHDGFSMFHSKVNPFNIVDATDFKRDPMIELAQACKEGGIGFGFYYSQNQDWTYPGGNGGPKVDAQGKAKSFDDYFWEKCYPEVQQITTGYGPIELVWFDTPGGMDKKYAQKLVELVHKNQPGAYVSGRVGHGLGDYSTLGDMEVPRENVDGIWETVDVTNDSWGYAWYDNNWKSSQEILQRTLSTVARGGTYMLNVGPKPDGSIPDQAGLALRNAGAWIKRYPETVYGAQASPWKHALPWGDATVQGDRISLLVYHWPADGTLYVPGLTKGVQSIKLRGSKDQEKLNYTLEKDWLKIDIPKIAPEKMVSVIEIKVNGTPQVEKMLGVDPALETVIPVDFGEVEGCNKEGKSWMEKFGEWKHVVQVRKWTEKSKFSYEIAVKKPGYYQVDMNYAGEGRMVWRIENSAGEVVQNQQESAHVYNWYPWGWMKFEKAGRYKITVSLVEGNGDKASLTALRFKYVE